MTLDKEIMQARKKVVSDGYEMSVGEIINLYKESELIINPDFQRLFRWDVTKKTRFIESLLLGIPIPPIFVVQNDKGIWELIDGLQRLSTILEFVGVLRSGDGSIVPTSALDGTTYLPSLASKRWEPSTPDATDGIGKEQQLQIKRARLRVEILNKESDPNAKYELFQRLNTGGSSLTPQEVRNCVATMVNPDFQRWLAERSRTQAFIDTTAQTQNALEQQAGVELALRFFSFRRVSYEAGLDIHEYLDKALLEMAGDASYPRSEEEVAFTTTFDWLNAALGENAFKRWDGTSFAGKFLMSLFEVIAVGISKNISALAGMSAEERTDLIVSKSKSLWQDTVFTANSGAGVRGTTRLVKLLPLGPEIFRP